MPYTVSTALETTLKGFLDGHCLSQSQKHHHHVLKLDILIILYSCPNKCKYYAQLFVNEVGDVIPKVQETPKQKA